MTSNHVRLSILEQFTACTPGTLIEEKSTAIAWHYRTGDVEFVERQARELRLLLLEAIQNQPLEVLNGSKVIEVRPRGINKGRVIERVLAGGVEPARLVAIGDDVTDEDMFAAMPPEAVTIHVGQGPSRARYRLPDSMTVRKLLRTLVEHESCAAYRLPS